MFYVLRMFLRILEVSQALFQFLPKSLFNAQHFQTVVILRKEIRAIQKCKVWGFHEDVRIQIRHTGFHQ